MKLMPAANTRISMSVHGRTLRVPSGPPGWKHPWYTTPVWLPKAKKWVAVVKAGFVNGYAPVVSTTAEEIRETRAAFFATPIDANAGQAEILQAAELARGEVDTRQGDGRVDVPLYMNPPVGLNQWRKIGWDGIGRVPQFFLDRGAANAPASAAAQLQSGGTINADSLQPPKNLRLLRACDIVLRQPRPALGSDIEITPDGVVTGLSLVRQTLVVRPPPAADRLRVYAVGQYSELAQRAQRFSGDPNIRGWTGDYEESSFDEVHISTVYLLSPPNAPPGSEPDEAWRPFIKHETFWNLAWAQRPLSIPMIQDIWRPLVASIAVLGGGAGLTIVAGITASLNDATQAAANILQAQSLAGSFWTPTGGGTAGTVPVTIPDPELTGLDKAARAEAKLRKAQLERRNRRLEPAFPHEGRSFNLSLLS